MTATGDRTTSAVIPLEVELVRAGPGTGKTYQLAQRFASLVLDAGHNPAHIAAVTFTRAAAAELRERVREALDDRGASPEIQAGVDDSPMLTIDAFSNWILRMSTDHRFVTTSAVSALLETGSRARRGQQWLLEHGQETITAALAAGIPMADPGFGSPHLDQIINDVVNHPARTRSQHWIRLVTDGVRRWPDLPEERVRELVEVIARFAEHEALNRLEAGDTSYEDTTALAVQFVKSPEGHEAIRTELSALLVDELQDTDPLQEELLNAIWSVPDEAGDPAIDRFLVGDLKQAIYQFRNADPRVMERFVAVTPPGLQHDLTVNRRSPAVVVDVLNAVADEWFDDEPALEPLDLNRDGAFVVLGATPMANPDDPTRAPSVPHQLRPTEARTVAAFLVEQRSAWEQGSCALLMPTRSALDSIEAALLDAGLPLLNLASAPHASNEIQEARVLLTAVADPSDAVATIGALRGPGFAIADREIDAALNSEGDNHRQKLANHVATAAAMGTLEQLRGDALRLPVGATVERVLDAVGLWDLAEDSPTWTNRLHWLATQANEFDRRGSGSLGRFLLHLRALAESERNLTEQLVVPPGEPVIQLMTMHNAKGLQFDTVIVAGLHKGGDWKAPFSRWQHDPDTDAWALRVNLGNDDPDQALREIEQTKRLLYVALSRAKTNLVVSAFYPHNPSKTRADDACALLRTAIKGCEVSDRLVVVETPETQPVIAQHVPAPLPATPRPRARTVTEVAAGEGQAEPSRRGRGADHGTKVHAAVAALIDHYGRHAGTTVEGLVAKLATFAVDDAVRADTEEILRLPTIATAIAEGRRIEAEYPVAGVIGDEPIYGVVDLLIEHADGSLLVADVKTDHQGEQDPAGTPYQRQLEIYAQLAGAQSTLLLGPVRSKRSSA